MKIRLLQLPICSWYVGIRSISCECPAPLRATCLKKVKGGELCLWKIWKMSRSVKIASDIKWPIVLVGTSLASEFQPLWGASLLSMIRNYPSQTRHIPQTQRHWSIPPWFVRGQIDDLVSTCMWPTQALKPRRRGLQKRVFSVFLLETKFHREQFGAIDKADFSKLWKLVWIATGTKLMSKSKSRLDREQEI